MKLKPSGERGAIYKIIENKEIDASFLKRCLATHTCPNCGNDLSSVFEDRQGGEIEIFECKLCGETY